LQSILSYKTSTHFLSSFSQILRISAALFGILGVSRCFLILSVSNGIMSVPGIQGFEHFATDVVTTNDQCRRCL